MKQNLKNLRVRFVIQPGVSEPGVSERGVTLRGVSQLCLSQVGGNLIPFAAILFVCLGAERADAQDSLYPSDRENCSVSVRLLEAGGHAHANVQSNETLSGGENSTSELSAEQSSERPFNGTDRGEVAATSKDLVDVRSELQALPFVQYKVLSRETQESEIGTDLAFSLIGPMGEKHAITISPTEHASRRVKFGVLWQGPQNENLLHTQMAVENGKSVVFGSDNELIRSKTSPESLGVSSQKSLADNSESEMEAHPVVICVNVNCM